jgi:uncharacterized SAM-binding protein YcdF (DUF218 family)
MISIWELTNVTARVVLPPGVLILTGLVGLALLRAAPRTGRWLATVSLVSLYVLSMPIVGRALVHAIEVPYADPVADPRGGAIVVLGGGSYVRAPEYGHDTSAGATLERLRYAAHLHKRIKKPIVVSSGNPIGADTSEAAQMQATLRDFGVTALWVEQGSNNTFENARLTYRMLEKNGITTIYLVTNAWHMPRARTAFERAGFTVIPAAMAFKTTVPVMVLDFVPSVRALTDSWLFFHEVVGLAWYRLKFAFALP